MQRSQAQTGRLTLEGGPAAAGRDQIASRGPWLDAWLRLRQNKVALACLAIIGLMLVCAVFAPVLAPYGFTDQNLAEVRQPPSWKHLFGTDDLGRDLLSRIIWGARTAAIVAFVVVTVGMLLGTFLGALAGYFGGWVETVIMRLADLMFAFPGLLLAIMLAATVRPAVENWVIGLERQYRLGLSPGLAGYFVTILALTAIGWPGLARLVRGQVLHLKEMEFVEAARAIGARDWYIIWRHLLPNTLGLLIVIGSMGMAGAIMSESILSFIGIGVVPPQPSWGSLISDSYRYWRTPEAHLLFIPGLVVAAVILAFNLLGDALNDALNPRSK